MTPGSDVMTFADDGLRLRPGAVARLELHAPARRNAMSRAMWAGLAEACAAIRAMPGVRVVILTGAGGQFSAGADISEFAAVYATPQSTAAYQALMGDALDALAGLPMPVLAQIHGNCIGGGCALALAADLRFAASDAVLGITPARLGIAYPPQDTARLIAAVGAARAKDLLFSARLVDGQAAAAMGLVDECLPPDALTERVAAYAGDLAERSPLSQRAAKAIVNGLQAGQGMAALQPLFEAVFAGPDLAEGRAAFEAKRPPRFAP